MQKIKFILTSILFFLPSSVIAQELDRCDRYKLNKIISAGELIDYRAGQNVVGISLNPHSELFQDKLFRVSMLKLYNLAWAEASLANGRPSHNHMFPWGGDMPLGLTESEARFLNGRFPQSRFQKSDEIRFYQNESPHRFKQRKVIRTLLSFLENSSWMINDSGAVVDSSGRELTLDVLASGAPDVLATDISLASDPTVQLVYPYVNFLRDIGIKVNLRILFEDEYFYEVSSGNFDIAFGPHEACLFSLHSGWEMAGPDVLDFLKREYIKLSYPSGIYHLEEVRHDSLRSDFPDEYSVHLLTRYFEYRTISEAYYRPLFLPRAPSEHPPSKQCLDYASILGRFLELRIAGLEKEEIIEVFNDKLKLIEQGSVLEALLDFSFEVLLSNDPAELPNSVKRAKNIVIENC